MRPEFKTGHTTHKSWVKVHGLSQRYSTLAKTLLAGWREDLADRIGWLRHCRDPSAIAGRAFDFPRYDWFQVLHGNHFLDTIPTPAMSLCNTDCEAGPPPVFAQAALASS
jgi:hypothetical protein